MVAVAALGGEYDAGGAVARVARVVRRVAARARPGAGGAAGRRTSTAPHRRHDHLRTAFTRQLVET